MEDCFGRKSERQGYQCDHILCGKGYFRQFSTLRRIAMFRKKFNSSALDLLVKHDLMLASECLRHSRELASAAQTLGDNWQKAILRETSFIVDVSRGREALRKTITEMKKGKKKVAETKPEFRYQVSSLFLRDCWEYLRSDKGRNERLHLVTGTITREGTRVLSRMEEIKYERQSSVYVSADRNDSHQKIVSLEEDHGHIILAVFHSHTSEGPQITAPSSIDQSFLKRMAKIGSPCLGGIFSLDGYVRFFMTDENFEIGIYGKRIEKIREYSSGKIFKIKDRKDHERKNI